MEVREGESSLGSNGTQYFCDLSTLTAQERAVINDTEVRLKEAVLEIREVRHGLTFEFPGEREVLDTICRWLPLETVCCPFLSFTLLVPSGGENIRLEMTGEEGVKSFLMAELG